MIRQTIRQHRNTPLTEGPIWIALVRLSVPIILANILQTAYQLTDTFWVGRLERPCRGGGFAGVSDYFFVHCHGGRAADRRHGADCPVSRQGRSTGRQPRGGANAAVVLRRVAGAGRGRISGFRPGHSLHGRRARRAARCRAVSASHVSRLRVCVRLLCVPGVDARPGHGLPANVHRAGHGAVEFSARSVFHFRLGTRFPRWAWPARQWPRCVPRPSPWPSAWGC